MSLKIPLIVIPTYNEAGNVEELVRQIFAQGLDVELLFIDDNSPDGTGKILEQLAKDRPSINVLRREEKGGIGSAHLAGINWAYENGYSCLITMDSDFSHSPKYISGLLEQTQSASVAVGSRFKSPDSLIGWIFYRKVLTNVGHYLTKHLLGIPYDATGAFRAYRLDCIPREIFLEIQSSGYSFFYESLYLLFMRGISIEEVSICLPVRTYGHSKMRIMVAIQGVAFLFLLVWRYRLIAVFSKRHR